MTPETKMLEAINYYGCLTRMQIVKVLGHSEKSSPKASSRLTELFKQGFVDYGILPHERAHGGGVIKVYILTSDGRATLRKCGISATDRQVFDTQYLLGKSKENAKKLPEYWRHVLYSMDFCINAECWQKTTNASINKRLTELDIHRDKAHKLLAVKPDSLLEIFYEKSKKRLWVEIDRGHYEESAFRDKVKALISFVETGKYIEVYGSRGITVLFIAINGETHSSLLSHWITNEIEKTEKQWAKRLFRITGLPPSDIRLFTEPVWSIPGAPIPSLLLA